MPARPLPPEPRALPDGSPLAEGGQPPMGTGLDIGVDLDGVGYDFVAQFRLWRYMAYGVPFAAMPAATTWDFHRDQWGMTVDEFLSQYAHGVHAGYLFAEGRPMAGFVDGLTALAAAGHRVHIVTSRVLSGAEAAARINTEYWLDFWGVPHASLTLTSEKGAVKTDLFIDDCAANYDALEVAGRTPYLLHQPWNATHPGRRVQTWSEFVDVVAAHHRS